MGVISDLTEIENEFNENEKMKTWKNLFNSLKSESDQLYLNLDMEISRSQVNRTRNRYRDVLPYDHSRVSVSCIGDNDYINASFVELDDGDQSRRYILTQGPLNGTISHFWRMIWEQHSTCIVMLNKIIEKDAIKCAKYYPISVDEIISYSYKDFDLSLSLVETIAKDSYVVRIFSLINKMSNETRRIIQYQYLSWPDFGVPLTPVSFLKFLWDIRSSGGLDDRERPCVVHCSAGIGRSGTFILIDLALLILGNSEAATDIDLKAMLIKLRKCRMGLVQAAEQLRFAYLAIITGAKSIFNGKETGEIKFDEPDSVLTLETEGLSSSEMDTDSDFSDSSDIMRSNSALDQAAAAVRSRRGIPLSKGFEDAFVISQSNHNNDRCASLAKNLSTESQSSDKNMMDDRRQIREIRCNKTRQKVEEIRANMRRQDLERERLLSRLGLNRLTTSLAGRTRTSFAIGISVFVGMLSAVCGLAVYKYIK